MNESHDVLLYNPLPWDREVSGPVSQYVVDPRGDPADGISGRHYQDRTVPEYLRYRLPVTTVPGYGYAIVDRDDLVEFDRASAPFEESAVVETDRYRIEFDRERGGIASWYDATHDCEWVERSAPSPLAGFVHEEVADRNHDDPRRLLYRLPEDVDDWAGAVGGLLDTESGWQTGWHARRRRATEVLRHRIYETPAGYEVCQRLSAPGVDGPVELVVRVPERGDAVTVEATWTMTQETRPEATYLAFPFDLEGSQARVDVGNQAVRTGVDQLDGSCHDYYVAQRWVDVSNGDRGVTVCCPINPMVQFDDFSFGDDADSAGFGNGTVLGWVTNNYWETNWPASQPGQVRARYHLVPHGEFSEADAHRYGREAEHARPVVQTLGETPVSDADLPRSGSLLDLPDPPAVVVQLKPDGVETDLYRLVEATLDGEPTDGAMQLVVQNAADTPTTASVGSGLLTVCDVEPLSLLGGETGDKLSVKGGAVNVDLEPREFARIRLVCTN